MPKLERPPTIDRAQVDFPRHATAHDCGGCGFPLWLVWPSNMVTCDNPICPADPGFLIEKGTP